MKDLITEGRDIQELFKRKFLNEDEQEDIKAILQYSYADFVRELDYNIEDPKFVNAIKSLAKMLPVKLNPIAPDVVNLKPTQNEIVLNSTLKYPMKDPIRIKEFLDGGIVAVAGRTIVTGGGGKFIIDGHHRWSQLFCINPYAKIKSIDLPIKDPISALKATQLGIAADVGDVPSALGGGVNLLKINETTLKRYVIDNVHDSVVEVFNSAGIGNTPEAIADHIWGNVMLLQINNAPIKNAPSRDIMPQTGVTRDFANKTPDVTKI